MNVGIVMALERLGAPIVVVKGIYNKIAKMVHLDRFIGCPFVNGSPKTEPIKYTNTSSDEIRIHSIRSLMQGVTEEVKDITILLGNEGIIKDAYKNFKTLLEVMATFGGEEVIEF